MLVGDVIISLLLLVIIVLAIKFGNRIIQSSKEIAEAGSKFFDETGKIIQLQETNRKLISEALENTVDNSETLEKHHERIKILENE